MTTLSKIATKHRKSAKLLKYTGVVGAAYLFSLKYAPQRAADMRAIGKGLTNASVAFPLVGYSVFEYINGLRHLEYGTQAYTDKRSEIHKRVAQRIFFMSTHCGGIYFKAGQYIGTLERLMPKEYVDTLKVLQDRGCAQPWDRVKVVYEHDLKTKIEDVFSEIDQTPIASASLAQVHRGVLRENGQEVAVKIQYP